MTSAPRGHDRLRHRLSLPPSDRSGPALRRPVVLLVLLVALLALPAIPTRELMPTDEPRFALVARQMVEDPAPIVPHLGYDPLTHEGEVYGDKPPVFFWLITLVSFLTGGVGEISARLPSFIASIAAVLLTYRMGRLLAGEAAGLAAGAILATSNQFFLRAGWCSIDMVLTALTLAATYCWLMAPRRPPDGAPQAPGAPAGAPRWSARQTRFAALGGLFASAATLSKGPVGLIYPLVFLAGDLFARRSRERSIPSARSTDPAESAAGASLDDRSVDVSSDGRAVGRARAARALPSRALRTLTSPALGAALVCYLGPLALWLVAISLAGGAEYVREILFRQNVTRYVAAWNNQEPWYYYLYRLPIGLVPWTLLLPAALFAPRGLPEDEARPLRGLLLSSAAIFLFFSASTGKRGVYLLPLYPALAILLAVAWGRAASRPFRAFAAAHAGALALLGAASTVALPIIARKNHTPALVPAALLLGVALAIATIASAVLLFRGRPAASLGALVAGLAVAVFAGSILLVPEANRRSGLRAFGSELAAIVRPDDYLIVDQEGYEQILFYSHLKGARRSFERTAFSIAPDGGLVLAPKRTEAPDEAAGRAGRPHEAEGAAARDEVAAAPDEVAAGTGRGSRAEPAEAPRDAAKRTARPTVIEPAEARGEAARRTGRLTEAERAVKSVRFPPNARVVFVLKGKGVERSVEDLRAALGPSCRTLLSSKIAGVPVYAIASR